MKYIKGTNRNQLILFPTSLDEAIDEDNEVRLIDLFVESLDMEQMGFKIDHIENGRPAYHPKDLLKLYIYGYLNRIRSSRQLEKQTKINIEVRWLLKGLSPDHNTISNFRKDNAKAIKKVFRTTVQIAKHFELIGGKLIAGDSTKLRAQNSKKNNYNQKKIERHIAYIDKKLEEYEQALNDADDTKEEVKDENIKKIKQEIDKQKKRKEKYQHIEKHLKESGQKQISTSDPDSRHMITRNNITEVAYNTQTTVDEKFKIPIDYKVTNQNDKKAMGNMLQRAKAIMRHNNFTALYDKGYHTGSEFKTAADLDIEVMVAVPDLSRSTQAPDPKYNFENFKYDAQQDCYICPEGHQLKSNGNWYKRDNTRFKQYKTKACHKCPVKASCTTSKRNGKIVQRSEFQQYIDNNKKRIENNKDYYRKRQAIVEHPFGTIKRQWGYSYIMTKKYIHRAEADLGLIFSAYNLRRMINIIGFKSLQSYLEMLCSHFLPYIRLIRGKIKLIMSFSGYNKIPTFLSKLAQKSLYLPKINGIKV